jgi:hypothetical protein
MDTAGTTGRPGQRNPGGRERLHQTHLGGWVLAGSVLCWLGCVSEAVELRPEAGAARAIEARARREAMARAQVWMPPAEPIAERDVLVGPAAEDELTPGPVIRCRYSQPESLSSGITPKFFCEDEAGESLRIKYDETGKRVNGAPVGPVQQFNAEVYTEVAATRLLWVLGFAADRSYPVQVTCTDCPEEPWSYIAGSLGLGWRRVQFAYRREDWRRMARAEVHFPVATLENRYPGQTLEESEDQGWSFSELLTIHDTPAQRVHREGLVAVLSILQHADAKPGQQRLTCTDVGLSPEEESRGCQQPVMLVHDLGYTFGGGAGWLPFVYGKMDIDSWRSTPVWSDRAACVLHVRSAYNSTLHDTKISEAGRRFASELLAQLGRQQLEDLFRVARFEQAGQVDRHGRRITTADWADVLEAKIAELRANRCE